MFDERGASNGGALVAVVLLVIALIAVVFLWQNDRDSADATIDVDIGLVSPPGSPSPPADPPSPS